MHASPSLEFDIRARARWLAEALATQTNLPVDFNVVLQGIQAEAAAKAPEVDQLTWFALERVSAAIGLPLVKFEKPGQTVQQGALVWVAPNIQANVDDAKALSIASLVVATDDWSALIQQARSKPARRVSP